jgi:hypothetical protein
LDWLGHTAFEETRAILVIKALMDPQEYLDLWAVQVTLVCLVRWVLRELQDLRD